MDDQEREERLKPVVHESFDDWQILHDAACQVIDDMGLRYRQYMIELGREMELPPEWRSQ